MSVLYLEVDDEITGAIARIRAVQDTEAIIVVPIGSRIATSRINFKLLVREGNERRLNLVAVSDEPSARALALSAGLPAYDSVAAAETALADFREQDRRLTERLGQQPAEPSTQSPATSTTLGASGASSSSSSPGARKRRSEPAEQTQLFPGVAGVVGDSSPAARPAARRRDETPPKIDAHRPARRIGATPIMAAAIMLVLLASVGYGAFVLLPTATITLNPIATQLAPAPFIVVADPDVAVSDVDAGVVPAQVIEIPLTVTDEFTSTGIEVHEIRATGSVRFRSENTLNNVPVPEGTVVSTRDGTEFETTKAAVVPRADFATNTPGTVDVSVRASRTGPRGNVAADEITVLPAGLRGQLVSVRNPDPTDGGRRVEEAVVTQEDFDAALIALDGELEAALAAAMSLPETTPRGLTLFPVTAQTGDPEPVPPASEVVGTVAPTFTVGFESVATVSAVNEGLVDELAAERIRAALQPAQHIVGDRIETTRSAGTVAGETIAYHVAPVAVVYSDPDRVALLADVRGKSIPDARQILAPYGMVEISMWPEFVDRLPDQTARISLVVITPSPRP